MHPYLAIQEVADFWPVSLDKCALVLEVSIRDGKRAPLLIGGRDDASFVLAIKTTEGTWPSIPSNEVTVKAILAAARALQDETDEIRKHIDQSCLLTDDNRVVSTLKPEFGSALSVYNSILSPDAFRTKAKGLSAAIDRLEEDLESEHIELLVNAPSSPLTTRPVARRAALRLRPGPVGSRTLPAAGEHCAAGLPVPTRAGSSHMETEKGDELRVRAIYRREDLLEEFEIREGIVIPKEHYRFDRYNVKLDTSRYRQAELTAELEYGRFFTGTRFDILTSFEYRPSPHFSLLADYEQFQVRLPEGDFTTRIARLGIDLASSVTMSWRNLIQWDNETDELTVNSRFRWIIEPGREFFVVLDPFFSRKDRLSLTSTTTELVLKLLRT